MKKKSKNRIIRKTLILLTYIGIWEAAALLTGSELLLPGPFETVKSLFKLIMTASFYQTTLLSLLRIMAGYLLGIAVGALLGILTAEYSFAKQLISPILSVIKATPVSSFIILVLLWLKKSMTPVFISFLMVMPIVWSSVETGILSIDKSIVEMAQVFNLSKKDKLKKIYIPSVMPQFISASITSLGFAWKSGVAAEVIATPKFSIGTSLYNSKIYLETPELIAWTSVVVALSVLIEKIIVIIIKKVGKKWRFQI